MYPIRTRSQTLSSIPESTSSPYHPQASLVNQLIRNEVRNAPLLQGCQNYCPDPKIEFMGSLGLARKAIDADEDQPTSSITQTQALLPEPKKHNTRPLKGSQKRKQQTEPDVDTKRRKVSKTKEKKSAQQSQESTLEQSATTHVSSTVLQIFKDHNYCKPSESRRHEPKSPKKRRESRKPKPKAAENITAYQEAKTSYNNLKDQIPCIFNSSLPVEEKVIILQKCQMAWEAKKEELKQEILAFQNKKKALLADPIFSKTRAYQQLRSCFKHIDDETFKELENTVETGICSFYDYLLLKNRLSPETEKTLLKRRALMFFFPTVLSFIEKERKTSVTKDLRSPATVALSYIEYSFRLQMDGGSSLEMFTEEHNILRHKIVNKEIKEENAIQEALLKLKKALPYSRYKNLKSEAYAFCENKELLIQQAVENYNKICKEQLNINREEIDNFILEENQLIENVSIEEKSNPYQKATISKLLLELDSLDEETKKDLNKIKNGEYSFSQYLECFERFKPKLRQFSTIYAIYFAKEAFNKASASNNPIYKLKSPAMTIYKHTYNTYKKKISRY